MILPVARTSAEAHLYMDLHPCQCGELQFDRQSSVVALQDGDLATWYQGTCPRCGTRREFLFRQPATVLPATADQARWGGDEPSQLIDPGEWLLIADAYADNAPADLTGLSPEDAERARTSLSWAAAAMDEALKFVPAGTDTVPEETVVSGRGRELWQRERGRFRANRITAVRDLYRDMIGQAPV